MDSESLSSFMDLSPPPSECGDEIDTKIFSKVSLIVKESRGLYIFQCDECFKHLGMYSNWCEALVLKPSVIILFALKIVSNKSIGTIIEN